MIQCSHWKVKLAYSGRCILERSGFLDNFLFEVEDEIAHICKIGNADVRVINEAPLMVRGEVVTNGILLYSRNEVFRVAYETSTRSEYFDFMPTAVLHREAFFDRLSARGEDG